MTKKLLKYAFIGMLFIVFLVVGCFSIHPWSKNFGTNFVRDSEIIKYPGFSKKSLESHDFQNYTEKLFEKNTRFRNRFIMLNNQLYYSLFKKSLSNSGIIIGKHDQLYEIQYILDYCNNVRPLAQLTMWADKIAELNSYFLARGKSFLYIITPSKAEHFADAIPNRFHCKTRGIKDAVYQMDRLLSERNVPHINGPELIKNATDTYNTSMFPTGGIHWNWLGSAIETAAVIEKLRVMTKIDFPEMRFTFTMGAPKEINYDSDRDLLNMALLRDGIITYKVPHLQFINPVYKGKPVTLAVVGGSFTWYINRLFLENKIFSEIYVYYYFNQYEVFTRYDQEIRWSDKMNMESLLKADIVILEENSAVLVSDHGKRFYEKIKSIT